MKIIIGFKESTLTNEIHHVLKSCGVSSKIQSVDEFFESGSPNCEYLNTVARDRELRSEISEFLLNEKLLQFSFIHPSAYVCATASIGCGVFIGPFASVFWQATISNNVIMAPYSMCSHKAAIGRNTILHPRATVAGSSMVGKNCLLNLNATVIDNVSVCDDVYVGAASTATKNINTPGRYVGSPARRVSD
jgi:UDP-3-O-[3-hydroxymyristoyl] glucosamine N-acyltransferase